MSNGDDAINRDLMLKQHVELIQALHGIERAVLSLATVHLMHNEVDSSMDPDTMVIALKEISDAVRIRYAG